MPLPGWQIWSKVCTLRAMNTVFFSLNFNSDHSFRYRFGFAAAKWPLIVKLRFSITHSIRDDIHEFRFKQRGTIGEVYLKKLHGIGDVEEESIASFSFTQKLTKTMGHRNNNSCRILVFDSALDSIWYPRHSFNATKIVILAIIACNRIYWRIRRPIQRNEKKSSIYSFTVDAQTARKCAYLNRPAKWEAGGDWMSPDLR